MRARSLGVLFAVLVVAWPIVAQPPGKLKTATILWVADVPQLVYDIRFAGGESTTMPTALKYLLKDIADSEGWYLTGKDSSKTVSSHSKRISIEYTPAKTKLKTVRVGKIDVKETPRAVECVVAFSKKPSDLEVTKIGTILETFARKYRKAAKSVSSTVIFAEAAPPTVWAYEVIFKEPPKDKK